MTASIEPLRSPELELQERLSVALLAQGPATHDEDLVHVLAVHEIADEAARGYERGLLHRKSQGRTELGRDSLHGRGVAPGPEDLT